MKRFMFIFCALLLLCTAALGEGDMASQRIRLTGGQKYPVYTGPGEDYLQAGDGAAVLSANDWIEVYAREGDWALVQYSVGLKHMRFGWISLDALPTRKRSEIPEDSFTPALLFACAETILTDDPQYSQAPVASLPAGSAVTRLASLGSWAYVEWAEQPEAAPVRGFVPRQNLTRLDREQAVALATDALLATNPQAELKPVTRDTLADYTISAAYDPETGLWTVVFDSGRDYTWSVTVLDETGEATLADSSNG